MSGPTRYSLVVPVLNEEAVLPILIQRIDALMASLDGPAEAVFVDDGSTDRSSAILERLALADRRFRLIELSRNFGHQAAITAGMEAAAGEAVIVMDADLQDPPEVALQMIAKWKEGFHIVHAQRLTRDGDTAFKRWTAGLYYAGLRRLASVDIPPDVGDFRLVDRRALDAFLAMPERDRYVRGMFGWLGFRQATVPFARPARAAGQTKYPLPKMLRLAANGVVGFSDAPLRIVLWSGAAVSALAFLVGVYALFEVVSGNGRLVRGWASTIIVVSFLSGINMLVTGVIGVYVGRIHAEVKGRPLYVVKRRVGVRRRGEADPRSAPLDRTEDQA
ncbi:MAG TPA: glycosyltransferase family 2 protein [Caulobacteraceae bacterium]|jgi:dolichol-phosphate mannosyltransferase